MAHEETDTFEALLREAAATDAIAPTVHAERYFGARYRVIRPLGEGGMGKVYEVHDEQLDRVVALKTLRHLSGEALYRFKNEFRALSSVRHPHLVGLYELAVHEGVWFFTMERVYGQSPRDFVASHPKDVVAAFRNIALGLQALHQQGLIHRDIKPSNILVAVDGSVKLLDFGLVAPEHSRPVGDTVSTHLAGTPRYMSPEARAHSTLTAATDWYAFGVMLGELIDDDAPRELKSLAAELQANEPDERPTGDAVLARLADRSGDQATLERRKARLQAPFVGRKDELAALTSAHDAVVRGTPRALLLTGQSGHGKTALIDAFVDGLDAEVRVLRGRCYPRESLPFNAFDVVVDQLVSELRSLSDADCAALLPRTSHQLARMFPVLSRVGALRRIPRGPEVGDTNEVQRRAIDALRSILGMLAEVRPLVVIVDDLHWADADSARVWRALTTGQERPRLLLIGSTRTEERAESPFFERLKAMDLEVERRAAEEELSVGPLSAADLGDLVALTGRRPEDAARIAQEAAGSPLMALALAVGGPGLSQLGDLIMNQVQSLARPLQRCVEALAVAAGPLPADMLARAMGLEDPQGAWLELEQAHLVRLVRNRLTTFHDKVGEHVASRLGDESRRAAFEAITTGMADQQEANPELMARCFAGLDDVDRASQHAEIAGDRAAAGLAWSAAARWYREALHAPGDDTRHLALLVKLAETLEAEGEDLNVAVSVYTKAVALADGEHRYDLMLQKGLMQLRVGDAAGLDVCDEVLRSIGYQLYRSTWRALPVLLWERTRVKGLKAVPTDLGSSIDAASARRFDILRRISIALVYWLPLQGTILTLKSWREAYASRDPRRISLGIRRTAFALTQLDGDRGLEQAKAVLAIAETVDPADSRDPDAQFDRHQALGLVYQFAGYSYRALEELGRAIPLIPKLRAPNTWDVLVAKACYTQVAGVIGHHDHEHIGALPDTMVRQARRRGDQTTPFALLIQSGHLIFLRDDRGQEMLDSLRQMLEHPICGQKHSIGKTALTFQTIAVLLYQGAQPDVFDQICEDLAEAYTFLLRANRLAAYFTSYSFALAYVYQAAWLPDPQGRARATRLAGREVRRMRRIDVCPLERSFHLRMEMNLVWLRGDMDHCRSLLADLLKLGEERNDRVGHAVDRWALAILDGGARSEPPADPFWEGIQRPARYARMYHPALFGPDVSKRLVGPS